MSSASRYNSDAKLYDAPYEYDGLQTPLYDALREKMNEYQTIFLRGIDEYLPYRMEKVGNNIPNSWKAWKQECCDLKRLMWLMNCSNNEYLAFCKTHFDNLCTQVWNSQNILEQVKVQMTETNLENERLKAENERLKEGHIEVHCEEHIKLEKEIERLKAELAEIHSLPMAECYRLE